MTQTLLKCRLNVFSDIRLLQPPRLLYLSMLFLVFTLSACSDDLSRGKAAEKIKEFYKYPDDMTIVEPKDFATNEANQWLTEKGFLTTTKIGWATYTNLSDEGRAYIDTTGDGGYGWRLKVAKRNFKDITGISYSQDKSIAKVDFTVSLSDITPFGEAHGLQPGQILNYSTELKKYDDGWRVQGARN